MVINDPLFGQLEWDADSGCWSGLFTPERSESYVLEITGQQLTDTARKTFSQIVRDLDAVKSDVADRLLADANQSWNRNAKLSHEELVSHLHPSSIRLDENGHVEVAFEDECEGDIFDGRTVITHIYPDGDRDILVE
jgi:hypothetical protein